MAKKRRNCKICGKYSAKRKVCKNCKEEQPYSPATKGALPFKRIKSVNKA